MFRFRYRKWFRRWCAALGVVALIYSVALPPTIMLAQSVPTPPLRVGQVDILRGEPETGSGSSSQFLSGSVVRKGGRDVNVSVAPGQSKPGSHIVYSDPVEIPSINGALSPLSVLGKRWVVGKLQPVPGGFGPLKAFSGGLEPAGRKVVELGIDEEAEFKLVLIEIDESSGTVTFEAFVRACLRDPLTGKWWTCTPYDIPTGFVIPLKEKSVMPIDINRPAFGFKLSAESKNAIKTALSSESLKKAGIQTAASVGSSAVSGIASASAGSTTNKDSSGSPSGKASQISPGAYQGDFTGQTMSPVNAPMTSGFGPRERPCPACSDNHLGVDFGVPEGTTVLAAAKGKIIFSGWIKGFGNTVILDHGSGTLSQYSHLKNGGFLGRVGSIVQMGSPIAISGNTGLGSGAHLHFAVIKGASDGNYLSGHEVNPIPFLKGQ
jgi:murein DD-endopeptidase MepM/ murein hydrolase activator NlpD